MLDPSDSVVEWVLKTVPTMGGGWCPPGMLGIGIGGTAEKAMQMAKEALMEPIDMSDLLARGPRDKYEELRLELYEKVNQLGIGAQGLGGLSTVLDVKIRAWPTHAANKPIAMIPNCAATRHAHFVLDGSGPAEFEAPSLEDWPKIAWTPAAQSRRVDLDKLTRAEVATWKPGDTLLLSGKMLTGRDAAHKRIQDMFAKGEKLPVDFTNRVIYYVGPVDPVRDEVVGPAGPTTATRMDKFTEMMLARAGRRRSRRSGNTRPLRSSRWAAPLTSSPRRSASRRCSLSPISAWKRSTSSKSGTCRSPSPSTRTAARCTRPARGIGKGASGTSRFPSQSHDRSPGRLRPAQAHPVPAALRPRALTSLPRWLGVAMLLAIAVTFSLNHIAARVTFDHGASVVTGVVFRSGGTALALLALLLALRVPLALPRPTLGRALAIGVVVSVQSYCIYAAVARLPVALALLAFNTYPMLFALMTWAAGVERPSRGAFLAMLVALFGLALALDVARAGGELAARWRSAAPPRRVRSFFPRTGRDG